MLHVLRPLDARPGQPHAHPRAQPYAPGAGAASILRLQQTAGNAAVQRLIQAQRIPVQRDAERDAARDRQLALAVTDADWTGAANILLPADERWMVRKLHGMSAGELRYLDDAVRRMGVLNSRLRMFIRAGLRQLGASDDSSAPAAGFGEIEGKATQVTDGAIRAGGNQSASYRFEITFRPNTALVDATVIDFLQMATVVSTVTSTPDPVGRPDFQNQGANGQLRQTASHARIDRTTGINQAWMGAGNAGQPSKNRRPWHTGDTAPAWMSDTPSRSVPNVTFDFETAAVCRQGKDQGTVYATVQWGFTIDANMKVIPKDIKYFNKESHEFDLAVIFWNTEAARTGSTQQPLPGNLH
jgi:hypothetical protein